ncbi:MAG: PAS domain S-box protein [Leptospirales bacterium]|nr:PAS domain S-box protein [Leptospirales bacterium]
MVSNVYQELFERWPNPLLVCFRNSIAYANQALLRLSSYSGKELLNQPVALLLPEMSQKPASETIARLKSGRTIPVEVRRGTLPDSMHEVLIIQDIAEQKLAEQGLRRSKTLLESLVTHTPAAVAMFDRDLRYIAFSDRWLTDYNLGKRDLTGLHHYDVFPEIRNLPEWIEIHKRCLAGATASSEDEMFPRQDGGTDWIKWEVKPWFDEHNEIGGIIMMTEVTTARKRAEEMLRLSEERFSQAFSASPVALAISRLQDGLIVDVNETFIKLFEFERSEVIGRTSTELGLFGSAGRAALTDQVRLQDNKQFEMIGFRKSGKPIEMLVSTQIITLEGEEHLLSTGIDISERKEAERARLTAEAELRKKNEELERFAATVSHDLRSPLITIQSFTEFVRASINERDPEKCLQELQYIEKAASKMDALLTELGSLARLGRQETAHTICDLDSIVADAIDLTAGRTTAAQMRINRSVIPFNVKCERRRLVEVFQNLFDNAAKFAAKANPELTITAERQENEVVVLVKDNGLGIAPAFINKVFELFEKLNHDKEGSGMGLALAQRIIELHGGRIWCHSDGLQKGTTFFCALPIAEQR